jgi:ubiquinone/menaquinone biosynthesis C-methylase UbiE
MKTKVSEKWKISYSDYYDSFEHDSKLAEWRSLGAIDKASNIVAACNNIPHDTVLEIGCGEGSVLKRLDDIRFGSYLYGLEISHKAVHATKSRDIKSLVECKMYDGYDIPYDDNKFDLAILSHVVEHLEYPRRLLYESARVANYVFIEVPLEETIRLKKDYSFDRVGHINFYSFKTFRRLVQTCDLDVLSQTLTVPSMSVLRFAYGKKGTLAFIPLKSILKISPSLATKLYPYHCSILCRKQYGSY